MPRQARMTGEYLHVIVRGIGKQILFEEDSDREKYLELLQKDTDETEVILLAYCLMENHVHLLVRDPNNEISEFMKKTSVSYAMYYNRKYDRSGHLFQDRYKSELITDDAYLLTVFRYILNNPAKAGFCPAEEYAWSSYHEYGKANSLTETGLLREMIGDEDAFHLFMQGSDDAEHMEAEPRKKNDAWAMEKMCSLLNVNSGTELQQYERQKRDDALARLKEEGLSVRQIERLTGINRGVIQKAKVVNRNRPC